MERNQIYEDIACRTGGDIYIGVVGPVRTGKSTFIKRFMETLVIPNIDNVYRRERARDELPQSGSGRTIMTAEPKFVPGGGGPDRSMEDGAAFSVRLIDCVGYLVPGAVGQMEDDAPRMVTTPWFDHEIPMTEAAEIGTRKVIAEHSTIGIVVTTDGTITDIPREDYLEAEERVIRELQELGKPFLVLLNCAEPRSSAAQAIAGGHAPAATASTCMPVNCLRAGGRGRDRHHPGACSTSSPCRSWICSCRPGWTPCPAEHPIKSGLYAAIRAAAPGAAPHPGGGGRHRRQLGQCDTVEPRQGHRPSTWAPAWPSAGMELPRSLFYRDPLRAVRLHQSQDDGDLMSLLTELSGGQDGSTTRWPRPCAEVRETGLRHRGAQHRRADAGGAGDRQAGGTLRRAG